MTPPGVMQEEALAKRQRRRERITEPKSIFLRKTQRLQEDLCSIFTGTLALLPFSSGEASFSLPAEPFLSRGKIFDTPWQKCITYKLPSYLQVHSSVVLRAVVPLLPPERPSSCRTETPSPSDSLSAPPAPSRWLPPSYIVSMHLTNPGTSHHWNDTLFVIL